MSDLLADPPRWRDRTDQCDLAERRAGHALRCIRDVPVRSAPPLSRVTAQLRAAQPRRRPTWILATAALVLGAATMASAAHLDLLPVWLNPMVKPAPPAPPREGGRQRRAKARAAAPVSPAPTLPPARSPEATPGVPASPGPEPPRITGASLPAPTLPSPAPAQTQRSRSAARKTAVVAREQPPARAVPAVARATVLPAPSAPAPSVAAPTALAADEAPVVALAAAPPPSPEAPETPEPPRLPTPPPRPSLPNSSPAPALERPGPTTASPQARDGVASTLTQVIRSLRVEHAPRTALRLLDRHDRELAEGGFAHEALLLRVEALLALGHRAELLRLLDGASLTDVAASRTLLVTRGELRAAANRCAEGIGDFDLVLARSRQADRQALIGRARCRKHLGDVAGMRADLERLRKEFPDQALPAELR